MEAPTLLVADSTHRPILLPLVRSYHEFERVQMSDADRALAVAPLLEPGNSLGRVWLIRWRGDWIGYVAVCFGYSIEFAGRDAFIDEFFLRAGARGHGVGSRVLEQVMDLTGELGISALHLEVAAGNHRARSLYAKLGFESRDRFHLMSWRRRRGDA